MGVPLRGRWQNAESYSMEYSMENRIAKAKPAVWLAMEEGVNSVELLLCIKRYSWLRVAGKIFKKRWRYTELFLVRLYWEIFIMFWMKSCAMVKHSSVTGVFELSGALTTDLDLDRVRLTLLFICWQNDNFDRLIWNGFLEPALRIKPNKIIAVFFFFRDSCDIGFRVQISAEFPRQVMNFSIIS